MNRKISFTENVEVITVQKEDTLDKLEEEEEDDDDEEDTESAHEGKTTM